MLPQHHTIKKIGWTKQNQIKKVSLIRKCSSSTKPKSSPLKYLFLVGAVGATFIFVLQNRKKEEEIKTEIVGLNYLEDAKTTANLDISPWQIPHDDKRYKGGEDTVNN